MASKRQKQAAELIKRNFSEILLQEGNYIYGDAMVTVTKVQISPDLSQAKIYLSIFNTPNKEGVMVTLQEHYSRLRQLLGNRIRQQVKRIPDFDMFIDNTLDEMYRLNRLFDRLEEEDQMGRHREEE